IVSARVTPRPPRGVALEVEVSEGEPTHIAELEVVGLEGLPPRERDTLVAALPLHRADVFDEGNWATAKTLLHDRLRELGYAEAQVEGVVLIDVKTREARLELLVRPGDVFRFGAI